MGVYNEKIILLQKQDFWCMFFTRKWVPLKKKYSKFEIFQNEKKNYFNGYPYIDIYVSF